MVTYAFLGPCALTKTFLSFTQAYSFWGILSDGLMREIMNGL